MLSVVDPILPCRSPHIQCYSNQLWISKWFSVAPVWLHVLSLRFFHELLQQSIFRKEERRLISFSVLQVFSLGFTSPLLSQFTVVGFYNLGIGQCKRKTKREKKRRRKLGGTVMLNDSCDHKCNRPMFLSVLGHLETINREKRVGVNHKHKSLQDVKKHIEVNV